MLPHENGTYYKERLCLQFEFLVRSAQNSWKLAQILYTILKARLRYN